EGGLAPRVGGAVVRILHDRELVHGTAAGLQDGVAAIAGAVGGVRVEQLGPEVHVIRTCAGGVSGNPRFAAGGVDVLAVRLIEDHAGQFRAEHVIGRRRSGTGIGVPVEGGHVIVVIDVIDDVDSKLREPA